MKNKVLVSIVIPVYNTETYLNKCIESIINQSYHNIEIILINDGSKDNSQKIIEQWSSKDSRIKYHKQNNSGVTKAREKGVELAKGDWICFVDSDDILPKDSISLLVKNSLDQDIVIGQVISNFEKWPFSKLRVDLTNIQYLSLLLARKKIHWGPVAKLFSRKLFSDFVFEIPSVITNGEDLLMNLRLGKNAKQIRVIDDIVYQYIYRENSAISKNPFKSIKYSLLFEKYVWISLYGSKRKLIFPLLQHYIYRCIVFFKNIIKRYLLTVKKTCI